MNENTQASCRGPKPDKVLLTDAEARALDCIKDFYKTRPTRGKRAKLNPPPRTDK
jgi:hypothetical protein